MKTLVLISPYWKEEHRWMVSSVQLAELWQRLGYRVVVVCMGSVSGVEEVSPTLTIHRRKDWFLPDPFNFGISLGFTRYVRRVLKQEQPEYIVINKVLFWTSFAAIPLRLTGHRLVLLTDALVGMTWQPRALLPKIIMTVGAWTVGWLVLLSAKRIVLFHPQSETLLKRLGIRKKTQVIPTGIDTAKYVSREGKEGTGSAATITYVGRLESVKGVDDFLAAVIPLKESFPNMNVQVVGWYKENHPLVQKYEQQVTFTGLRHDVPEVLQATDIFVLPSHSEGLSNALMEAMVSGCACVATEVGGNKFLIQNGVSGFLYPAGDRAALQAHLRRLLEDAAKRRMLGAAARKRIEEQFSWDKIGTQYQQLFQELAETKPRVVILSTFATPMRSGAEACAEEVARELSEQYDIHIVTARMRRDLPRHDVLFGYVPVTRVGFGFGIDKWLYPIVAPFVVRSLRPRIVHAVLESFAGMALVLCSFMPRVRTILTCQSTNTSLLLRLMHQRATVVTGISRALIERSAKFNRADATLIPNGLRLSDVPLKDKVPGRLIFVGRLEKMKGIDTLLAAMEQITHDAHLKIVGAGSLRSALEKKAKALGVSSKVTFVGFKRVPDVYEDFAEASIFCGLSRSEAFGNVFVEAQAAGCAVIGTRIGGIPDIIDDGATGLLVPVDDPMAAAKAIDLLLADDSFRQRLAEAGRRNAQQYDWAHIAKKYASVYETLLARPM